MSHNAMVAAFQMQGFAQGRYLLLLVPLSGLLAGCPLTAHPPTPESPKAFREPTTGRRYWLYVPSTYSTDREWPMVISLHGTYGWDGA